MNALNKVALLCAIFALLPLANAPTSQDTQQGLGLVKTSGRDFALSVNMPGSNAVLHPEMCGASSPPSWCSGSTPDAWINAAFAALKGQQGVVDLSGFQSGALAISNTITCGALQTLVGDSSVELQPQSAGLTVIRVDPGCHLSDIWVDVSHQRSFSGAAISLTGNYQAFTATGQSVAKSYTPIRHLKLTAPNISTGDAIYIGASRSSTQSVAFVTFDDVSITGFGNGLHLASSGNGWINSNTFSRVTCIYTARCVLQEAGAGSEQVGNHFPNLNDEASSIAAVVSSGAGSVSQNEYSNITIFDTARPVQLAATGYGHNFFSGYWDGTVSDKEPVPSDFHDLKANDYALPGGIIRQEGDHAGLHFAKNRVVIQDDSGGFCIENHASTNCNLLGDDNANYVAGGHFSADQGIGPSSTANVYWTTGAGAPSAHCAVGSLYTNTAARSASTVLYVCYPANTWKAVAVP